MAPLVSSVSFYSSSRCLTGAAVESVPTVGVPPNVGLDVEAGTSNVISKVAMVVGAGEGSSVAMIISEGGRVGYDFGLCNND